MKNILAENMLRFGVKNLKESDVKKIHATVLNEQALPPKTVLAIANSLIDKVAKGEKLPTVTVGQYMFKVVNISTDRMLGEIISFMSGTMPPFPLPYGNFTIDRAVPESSIIQPQASQALATYNEVYTKAKTSEIRASNINNMYDFAGNINDLRAILNAHPQKQNIMTAIANFQKSNDAIKPLLKGIAQAFLVGAAPKPAPAP